MSIHIPQISCDTGAKNIIICMRQYVFFTGNGLFIGNSMPIRDMDMYATWQRQQSNAEASTSYSSGNSASSQGRLQHGVGMPVGSNRGASGIDGVLSTAAGFAAGLRRPTTLVVGDVSFLHDINGLNLLRTGECQRMPQHGNAQCCLSILYMVTAFYKLKIANQSKGHCHALKVLSSQLQMPSCCRLLLSCLPMQYTDSIAWSVSSCVSAC